MKEDKVKKPYLMWIGKEHYAAIGDYTKEAMKQGISKRLPGASVAQSLMEQGTVIFVAHDEGEHRECPACLGKMECRSCRLRREEIARLNGQISDLHDDLDSAEKESTAAKRINTKIKKRHKKATMLIATSEDCPDCLGSAASRGGTGGKVEFNDGTIWDHVRYNYWLHLPKKWTPEELGGVKEHDMCERCGGTGRLPEGRVFGCFVPSDMEYIMRPEDDGTVKALMKGKGLAVVDVSALMAEEKRGCGFRKSGGVYAVAQTKRKNVDAKRVVEELVKKGAIESDGVQIKGDFVRFLEPVPIAAKRFRGIKSWSLDPRAEREAELALRNS